MGRAFIPVDISISNLAEGSGRTPILQQCVTIPVKIEARLTQCGYQPFFQTLNANFTVGKDGSSLHPFQDCFWNNKYVTLNDIAFSWINDEWIKQEPSIHVAKIKLIQKFEELPIKAYDYLPQHHSMYYPNNLEQMNVLSKLIGRISMSNTNSLSSLVQDNKSRSNFWDMTSWIEVIKYGFLALIIFLLSILVLWICVTIVPFYKIFALGKRKRNHVQIEQEIPLTQRKSRRSHSHRTTKMDPEKGLCWDDGCVILKMES
jgi:hypothetical protein